MNRGELKSELKSLRIRDDAYSLDGSRDEAYCLDQSRTGWSVYYSERGLEAYKKKFETESEACEYLKTLLVSDRSTHY
jgi:hypothetical protein